MRTIRDYGGVSLARLSGKAWLYCGSQRIFSRLDGFHFLILRLVEALLEGKATSSKVRRFFGDGAAVGVNGVWSVSLC